MPAAARLPVSDIARIARVVTAFEAGGAPTLPQAGIAREARLSLWMLNAKFTPAADDDSPFNAENAYGRRFQAQAIQCQPTRLRVQMLRLKNLGAPTTTTFQVRFGGAETDDLDDDITAAELQTALEALPGLQGSVAVIGHESPIGDAADTPLTYAAQQWHILYSDELTATTLPTVTGNNVRLFRDWWLPTNVIDTLWTGLPNDARLEPGAFGWCLPFDVLGWTWIHGECWTQGD